LSAQSDVVLRVIQRICDKGKRNVLSFGYACVNESSFIPIQSAPNICSYRPNPTTVTIKNSILWRTLLSRIGDDVMMYLLEHCSLFMLVPPSCCFQLCGVPIYSLTISGTKLPSTWLRQSPAKRWCNISLKCIQKKVQFYKGLLSKDRKWKERLAGASNGARAAVSSRQMRQSTLSVPESKSVKKPRLEVVVAKWLSKVTVDVKSLKRCRSDDDVAPPAKRLRDRQPSVSLEGTSIHSAGHVESKLNNSSEITEQSGRPTDRTSNGACEWKGEGGNIDKCEPKDLKFGAHVSTVGESSGVGQGSGADTSELVEGGGIESNRTGHFVHDEVIISSVDGVVAHGENSEHKRPQAKISTAEGESVRNGDNQTVAETGEQQNGKEVDQVRIRDSNQSGRFTAGIISSTQNTKSASGKNIDALRQCEGTGIVLTSPLYAGPLPQTSTNAETVRNRRKWATTYIERGNIMYCSNRREHLPNTFILNCLQGLSTGGQRLVKSIFLNSDTFEKKKPQVQPNSYWRKKKFPKRYWQMRDIFFRLLRNHKQCPYPQLLMRNCFVNVKKGRKIFGASSIVRNIGSNSFPVTKVDRSSHEIELKDNGPVGEAIHPAPKQDQLLSKNVKGHTSMRTALRGHSSTVGSNLKEQADPLRSLQRPGQWSPTGHLPEAVAVSHQADGKVTMSIDYDRIEDSPGSDTDLLCLLKQHSSPFQVYRFVRECLLKVIPDELWGSNHNKCRFLKNVKKFISLGRFDKFSCSELMWKMRVNDCTWLRLTKGPHFVPASEHQLREEILAKFLVWLMGTYVVQLLKSFFYITETTFMKNMLFYYRKRVWNEVQRIGVWNHLAKVQLQPISSKELEQKWQQKAFLPPSSLRFIPKRNGLRPIVRMRNMVAPPFSRKVSSFRKIQRSDSQMKVLFGVLNYECQQNPALMGSSVFGLDAIYKAWREFVLQSSKAGKLRGNRPYYFVKADVTGAYDTIPHAKLMEVVSGILNPSIQESYCIRHYTKVWVDSSGQIQKSFKNQVSTMKDLLPNMKEFVSHLQQEASLQDTVLVEQGLILNESSGQVFSYFKQMIENSTIRIGNKYYAQCCGIPQGSLLSTLLCSLCYGDMDKKLLSGIQEDGLMLRLVDDFLLVTPHLAHAKSFLRILAAGIPEYGCFINPHKTVVNFVLDENLPGCSKTTSLPEHSLFPWCGLLFDTQTLEVYCDYSSYANTSIRSSLTFSCSSEAGKNLRRKLLAVLKLKCHHIFLDLEV
ncbi:telomerase reverse transcriptase, partial [Rhincodon typus]|uniref:telomerase reverse transcriptase n=1 Tax=Rhincodon typus TaxID=259920 RepID=UPI00202F7775